MARAAREAGVTLDAAEHDAVAREQLRLVLLHTRWGTVFATAFAVLLALYVHGTVPATQVQAWLVLKIALAAARMALAQAYARWGDASPQRRRWEAAMLALLALDGLVWGVAGWRLAAEAVPVAALAAAAVTAVSCVATFGLQVRLAATAAYVVPMLLPTAAGLAARPDDVALLAAAGQGLLLLLLLATSRATSQRLALGLLLRRQADRLVADKQAALQLAQQRSAERDRFLAKVSHELRTPLHGILGVARLMHLEATDARSQRRLELIESSGVHLQGLINDLLDASMLEAGRFVLHDADFDLAAELDQLAEVFALRAADKGLAFELQLNLPRPCWVRGDAARWRQVLHNLLGNAVKFTVQGGVRLQAGPGAAPDSLCFTVRDTGPGLQADELASVFEPFAQARRERPADGVGLGLTIARELALAMGGHVLADSRPGEGSAFHFEARLPAVAGPAAGAPVAAAAAPGAAAVERAAAPVVPAPPPTRPAQQAPPSEPAAVPGPPAPAGPVLVAEDDEVNALIVGAYLDSLGLRHERVADGQQAVLRALRDNDRPALVLMDCRMPVMDGLAATAEIRRQERLLHLPPLPILALTAADGQADRQACLSAGMDRVIGKPFTLEQLVQALQAAGPAERPLPGLDQPPAQQPVSGSADVAQARAGAEAPPARAPGA